MLITRRSQVRDLHGPFFWGFFEIFLYGLYVMFALFSFYWAFFSLRPMFELLDLEYSTVRLISEFSFFASRSQSFLNLNNVIIIYLSRIITVHIKIITKTFSGFPLKQINDSFIKQTIEGCVVLKTLRGFYVLQGNHRGFYAFFPR